MPLTDRQIKNAKPAAKAYKLADGGGLYLQVTPAGGKLWRLKYRVGGKEKLFSIGKYLLIFISLLEEWEATESAHRLTLTRQTKPSGTYMDVCGLKGYLKNRSAGFR